MKKCLLVFALISMVSFIGIEKSSSQSYGGQLGLLGSGLYRCGSGLDFSFEGSLRYTPLGINAPIISNTSISGNQIRFTIYSEHLRFYKAGTYLDLEVVCRTNNGINRGYIRIWFY